MLSRHKVERALGHVVRATGGWYPLEGVWRAMHGDEGISAKDIEHALAHPRAGFQVSLCGGFIRVRPAPRPPRRLENLDEDALLHVIADDVVSASFCATWVKRIEHSTLETAVLSTAAGPLHRPALRNNERLIVDDPDTASALWPAVAPHVPHAILGGDWVARGLNTRLRLYRYRPGTFFKPHRDGAHHESAAARSWYTVLLYLDADMQGGATHLIDAAVRVTPRVGRLLAFQHGVRHAGETVQSGVKHVLRTDVMYTRMA